jgi:zinc and cadmium transporter
MDTLILWIAVFTALGGVLSVLAAAGFLLLPAELRARLLAPLVSFAIGTMLGATFLGILPNALEAPGIREPHTITVAVLLGLLAFFLLEKMVIWRHCHIDECDAHGSAGVAGGGMPGATAAHGDAHPPDIGHAQRLAAGNLILIGDSIHNFVDGVLIAAAFLTDIQLGIVTSIAVIAHEIPQEVGDFAILLNSGFSRGRALAYNVLASLTTVIGGVVAYFSLSLAQQAVPYVLAVAASSFIYIAVADLIPGLHKRTELGATAQQIALILLGIGAIALTDTALH